MQKERDDLYNNFVKRVNEVQQKSSLKTLVLEKKVTALVDSLEKREVQLDEVLSASKLDPASLSVMTRKLEVRSCPRQKKKLDNVITLYLSQEIIDAKNTSVTGSLSTDFGSYPLLV
jgi:hypothetical protein